MVVDQNQKQLFIMNLRGAYRAALLLATSLRRLENDLPLDPQQLDSLDDTIKEKLDAFRVRFGDLQDLLGAKVFRSLLILEQEKVGSHLDVLHQADKRRLMPSLPSWIEMRNLRNAFAHDYPEHEIERIEALNLAYKKSDELLSSVDKVVSYTHQQFAIDTTEFSPFHLQVKKT